VGSITGKSFPISSPNRSQVMLASLARILLIFLRKVLIYNEPRN
jgi:hypothetical protein